MTRGLKGRSTIDSISSDWYFDVIPGGDACNCRLDLGEFALYPRLGGGEQDHNGDSTPNQVLLISEVSIRGDQNFITFQFRCRQKVAILELGPSQFKGCQHLVRRKVSPQWSRSALVKQDLHAAAFAQATASASSTASTCAFSTPGDQAKNSSTVAPSRRFSNKAATGTRVPRKTHAPLTFSGSRSTAAHLSHASIHLPPPSVI